MVLTRDVLTFLHEKSPRNTSISSQALAKAMTKVVVLPKGRCKGLQEDIKWVPRQIPMNGEDTNPRGYRIDFEGESKLRALEVIKEMSRQKQISRRVFHRKW